MSLAKYKPTDYYFFREICTLDIDPIHSLKEALQVQISTYHYR